MAIVRKPRSVPQSLSVHAVHAAHFAHRGLPEHHARRALPVLHAHHGLHALRVHRVLTGTLHPPLTPRSLLQVLTATSP